MSDFNARSDSVNVEEIMEQIRSRIRDKRGVDYTEEQIRELAQVKLDRILDPRGVRSDLLEAFRRQRPPYEPPVVPPLELSFESHRPIIRFIRRLLFPVLKLFFNPAMFVQAFQRQQEINAAALEREIDRERQRRDLDGLQFEVMHNLVFELTRMGIEVKNLRMRVESLSSRVDFMERRTRSLESVVVYKPTAGDRFDVPPLQTASAAPLQKPIEGEPETAGAERAPAGAPPGEGPGQRSRRRRRRRGRRGRVPAAVVMEGAATEAEAAAEAPVSGAEDQADTDQSPADDMPQAEEVGQEGDDES